MLLQHERYNFSSMVVAARLAFAQPCLAAPPVLHKCNLLMNVERVPLSSIFHGSNKYILVDRTLNVIKKGERFRLLERVIFLNEKKEGAGMKLESVNSILRIVSFSWVREKRLCKDRMKCDNNCFYWDNFINMIHFYFEGIK